MGGGKVDHHGNANPHRKCEVRVARLKSLTNACRNRSTASADTFELHSSQNFTRGKHFAASNHLAATRIPLACHLAYNALPLTEPRALPFGRIRGDGRHVFA